MDLIDNLYIYSFIYIIIFVLLIIIYNKMKFFIIKNSIISKFTAN